MYSPQDTAEAVGCPIRTSMDQSLFAAPHGFSQRTTSFIASQRQGIHQMPLSRLIALISQCPCQGSVIRDQSSGSVISNRWHGIGKTSCKDLISHPLSGRACGQARPAMPSRVQTGTRQSIGTESQIPSSQCQRTKLPTGYGRQNLSRLLGRPSRALP